MGRSGCRAGTSPVILTFDDSSPGQFRYVERHGEWVIDPDCAVGILEAFEREHPGFGHAATFYVLPGADPPEPPLRSARARHAEAPVPGEPRLRDRQPHALARQPEPILGVRGTPAGRLGPGVDPAPRPRLSPPHPRPADGRLPRETGWVTTGAVNGSTYRHDAILMVSGGPAPSPRAKGFDATLSPASRRSNPSSTTGSPTSIEIPRNAT